MHSMWAALDLWSVPTAVIHFKSEVRVLNEGGGVRIGEDGSELRGIRVIMLLGGLDPSAGRFGD